MTMENPQLRRGPSGPMMPPPEGGNFAPFDSSYYYDPEYAGGVENGSIAGPFVEWAQLVAIAAGTGGTQVYIPAYPIVPGVAEIPTEKQLVIQGVYAHEEASYINDFITLGNNGGSTQVIAINDTKIDGIHLTGGNFPLKLSRCEVSDIDETLAGYGGTIYGVDSAFGPSQDTITATVNLKGGHVTAWSALNFELEDMHVGTPDGITAGVLIAHGTSIVCRGVTFAEGSTIEFFDDEGELFLDPESYKSFLDNDIGLANGHVTRLDGSWPRDAIVYADGETINFTKNPRAILNAENTDQLVFAAPLTREVQLLIVYTAGGEGGGVTWPDNVYWTDGLEPTQFTTIGSMSLFRFDYEEDLDIYFGWVVGMDFQGP